jgi:hypothetical protein
MLRRRSITILAVMAGVLFPAAAIAAAVEIGEAKVGVAPARLAAAEVLERPAQRLQRTIDVQVRELREQARRRAERERRRELARQDAAIAELGVSMATLESIAACESGGDPTIVSSDGTYRGKYQFDYGTWASVGGSGDPAAAPEAEQDYRAALLYSQSGSSPWPNCGA